jgi:hypothetical protein
MTLSSLLRRSGEEKGDRAYDDPRLLNLRLLKRCVPPAMSLTQL